MPEPRKPDPAAEALTPRGAHDPIHDPHHHGKEPDSAGEPGPPPPDSDDGASKDARDRGNNGNPAQSSGRVTMEEQNASPESPGKEAPAA